jgi:AraC-like DNA-binding protein
MLEFKAVIEFIEQNYQNHISLDELSKVMGMCSKYFCKIFRDVFNKTPIDYLNTFRIEKACELLVLGQNSITEVAYLCGFNDSCYFARCFKKYKNTTPKKYMIEKR